MYKNNAQQRNLMYFRSMHFFKLGIANKEYHLKNPSLTNRNVQVVEGMGKFQQQQVASLPPPRFSLDSKL